MTPGKWRGGGRAQICFLSGEVEKGGEREREGGSGGGLRPPFLIKGQKGSNWFHGGGKGKTPPHGGKREKEVLRLLRHRKRETKGSLRRTDGQNKEQGKKERIGFEPPQVHFHRKVGLSGKRQQKYSPQSSLIAVALATKKREGQKGFSLIPAKKAAREKELWAGFNSGKLGGESPTDSPLFVIPCSNTRNYEMVNSC